MQLITFHPFQTKPVSQHLFSCHSPLGTPISGPQLATTAKLEKSVSLASLGAEPQGRSDRVRLHFKRLKEVEEKEGFAAAGVQEA